MHAQQCFNDVSVRNWLRLAPNPATGTSFDLQSQGSLLSVFPMSSYGQTPSSLGSLPSSVVLLWDPTKAAFRASYMEPTFLLQEGSAAFGWAVADGLYSFAAGGGMATGETSAAFNYAFANNIYSFAAGEFAYANGYTSFAGGGYTMATGGYSMAVGLGTKTQGTASFATGENTVAGAFASTAIGRYNIGNASSEGVFALIDTDPVFEVGIGKPPTAATGNLPVRVNALTIYKNGNAEFEGVVRVAPGGDISIGTFTARPTP